MNVNTPPKDNQPDAPLNKFLPLFAPHEEPNQHRVKDGVVARRRPSPLPVVQNLRAAVREWREAFYPGASETTRHLLHHWFAQAHRVPLADGGEAEFRYYFCQREAIETLIYLREVRGVETTSQLWTEFGGARERQLADGIPPEEDAWSRTLCKLATGAGKTKVMSLAVVWSYFHALREENSPLAKHFVIIAPNIIVFERLREDFRPDGGADIFDRDPLIPPEWRGDWNMSVVLQDEAGGAATGGTLYLTNIHRLYKERGAGDENGDDSSAPWAGPKVNRNKALDTGAALRERILQHKRILILNDEAHHVWDSESAWFEAIGFFHKTLPERGGKLVGQIDFTATPRDRLGQPLKHIICDTPLGEAVDAGIVKTPVLGTAADGMEPAPDDDAGMKYDRHLRLGYGRWQASFAEWQKSGKKPLMFVMCENTGDADQITRRLQSDPVFKDLNGKTFNLHTNLKGKIKKGVFEPSEKEISDEDLRALRKLSREIDSAENPYRCIVSVLMLREGWDVRNVTTIVPLRALSAANKVLGEQVLGRGLRRIMPPGGVAEIVTVVEHAFFVRFYQEELAQEGLDIEVTDVNRVPKTTVSIYPDGVRKDVAALDISLPCISAGAINTATLGDIDFSEVEQTFNRLGLSPLPLGNAKDEVIHYEGRHLVTGEIVEKMKIHLPLLHTGFGAVSYFVKELEMIVRLRGAHAKLAPLLSRFWTEQLFDQQTTLGDPALVARLADGDVREYTRAVFVPLLREKTTLRQERRADAAPISPAAWKPFQATDSETHPVKTAKRTLFNLVPCNRQLEAAFSDFLEHAGDVAAFVKNAGPQCLRIDYLGADSRLAFYLPDFFVRLTDGRRFLVETKGREDRDVPCKARAAVEWCKSASAPGAAWSYLYVSEGLFGRTTARTLAALASEAAPELTALVNTEATETEMPLFAYGEKKAEELAVAAGLLDEALLNALPPRPRKAAEEAAALFRFYENKPEANFAPLFQPLLAPLDDAAKQFVFSALTPGMPDDRVDQEEWFRPPMRRANPKAMPHYDRLGKQLKRLMLWNNPISPLGLLRDCLDFAVNDKTQPEGIFKDIRAAFGGANFRELLSATETVILLRNRCIAHGGCVHDATAEYLRTELTDRTKTAEHLRDWLELLKTLIARANPL